ncbi:MAG: class I SAM-dependent RNA methyltransferase, partial [Myxococcales bacterium]
MDLFAVCAPGLEPVLQSELRGLGMPARSVPGGAELKGEMRDVERLNLWLRTASRVLVRLGEVKATSFTELVRKASALPFETVARPGEPVALRVTCRKSRLYHSGAVAQRLHEALQGRLGGEVPLADHDEESAHPAQLLLARFDHDVCTVSGDSSGALLHRRGYRLAQSQAPLRETLAAAVLLAAGYTGAEPLLDPLCGSGTIPIEAALIARRRAPGLVREFAFQRWPGHDARGFESLRAEAREHQLERSPAAIASSDADAAAIAAAQGNAQRAGVAADLRFDLAPLREARPPAGAPGLIATNPPYGVRLRGDLPRLYAELRDLARRSGYRVAALSADRRAAQ